MGIHERCFSFSSFFRLRLYTGFLCLLCFVERSAACSSVGIYEGYIFFFLSFISEFSAISYRCFFPPSYAFTSFFTARGGWGGGSLAADGSGWDNSRSGAVYIKCGIKCQ